MSYAQWSSFAFYNTGNVVSYQGVNYSALQANVNVIPTTLGSNWVVLPSPSGGGVTSIVNGAGVGVLTMSLVNGGSVVLDTKGGINDIGLTIPPPIIVPTLNKLNALNDAVTLVSPNTSIKLSTDSPIIYLQKQLPIQIPIPANSAFVNTVISTTTLTTLYTGTVPYTGWLGGKVVFTFYLNCVAKMRNTGGSDTLSIIVKYTNPPTVPNFYNNFYIQTLNNLTGCNAVTTSLPITLIAGNGNITFSIGATSTTGDRYDMDFKDTWLFMTPVP